MGFCRPSSAFPNHGSAGPALRHHHGQGGVPEYSSTYERVTGSIQHGSSFDGLLTRMLTGSTVIADRGQARRPRPQARGRTAPGAGSRASGGGSRHRLVGGDHGNDAGLDRIARPELGKRTLERHTLPDRSSLPQSGEREERAVLHPDEPRLAGRAGPRPLVEAVGRDEAAPARRPGCTEGGLRAHRLGPRVDEPVANIRLLGPARDQPRRSIESRRPSSPSRTTATFWLGATL